MAPSKQRTKIIGSLLVCMLFTVLKIYQIGTHLKLLRIRAFNKNRSSLKLCFDYCFQRVITACSWVFKFEITTWKLKSVTTVYGFWSVKIQVSLWLKWTIVYVDINASSKLKILLISAFWVFNRNFSISWKLNSLSFQTLKSHIYA